MAQVFSDPTIDRFKVIGENEFVNEYPCIVDRISLSIAANTATYTLPSYVTSIRRITWLGQKVWPLPHRDLRTSYTGATTTSKPDWYIYNNIGQSKIQFYPTPGVAIAQATTGLWGSNIATACIVEFYRLPDQVNFTIPLFFRRKLLKCYVNKRSFSMETKSQNLKNRDYWNDKYAMLKQTYGTLLEDLNNRPRKLILDGNASENYYRMPSPRLPARFGVGVDE